MNRTLRKEEKQLQYEFRKIYRTMKIYLAGKYLNKYANEEVLLEIVGMCIEGAQRGATPAEVFGTDYKQFCDEISVNTKRQKLWEIVLYQLSALSVGLFILFLCIWLMTFAFPFFGTITQVHIRINSLLYGILIMLLSIGSSFYAQTYAFHKTKKTFAIYMICYMSIYMLIYVCLALGSEGEYLTFPPILVLPMMGLFAFGMYGSYIKIQRTFWKHT